MIKLKTTGELITAYITGIVSVIMAIVLGAHAFIGAIALFTKNIVILPSLFFILGNSIIVSGFLALAAGIVSHLAFNLIKKSGQGGELVKTSAYNTINLTTISFCFITAAMSVVVIIGYLFSSLITMNDYTNWGSIFLGAVIPLLIIGLALAGAGYLICKLQKGEGRPAQLSIIAICVASIGLILAIIAVPVYSNTSYNSGSLHKTIKKYKFFDK